MKQAPKPNSAEARRAEKRRRRRRRRMIRTTIVLVAVLLLLTAIVFGIIEIAKASRGETATFFGVQAVEVEEVDGEGTVRYSDAQIIEASGIYIGQSLLAVNKVQASNAVLRQFPYLDYVEIGNSSFSTITIRVAEAQVLAALQTDADWLIVGENNHILERVSADALPDGVIGIMGVTPVSDQTGGNALDERSLRICTTLIDAVNASGQENITSIDVSEKTNIRMWWKDRIEIILGNESNLAAQVTAFHDLLPTLLDKNGDTAAGQLDMTSFADDNQENDRAVFTPTDALKQAQGNAATTEQSADDGATSAVQQTSTTTGG